MNVLPADKRAAVERMLAEGAGIRATVRALGISKNTALRYSKMFGVRACGCGRPASHKGRCLFRRGQPAPPRRVETVAPPSFTAEERKVLAIKRSAVIRRGKLAKSSTKELQAMVAASTVTVKRYPIGAHAGWQPSWMERA